MRQLLGGLAAALLTSTAGSALAQQGSMEISAAAQAVTGDPQRLAGQSPFEPDAGVVWTQPGTRFGMFNLEVRGTRRGELPHLGRAYAAVRDVKFRGLTWTFEGGDAYFAPGIGDYRFTNLFTPAVTFSGGAISARTARTAVAITAGRATAWRNIFGSDPDALGQTLVVGRATHKVSDRIDVNARASRIQTADLEEFGYTIADSRQASGGVRLALTPAIQMIADAGLVEYRREGATALERDASFLVGSNVLLSRGWVQFNASRFSPGEFPALNYPLQDREGLFVAGEYDVWSRLRAFAGWEGFRTNLEPAASAMSLRPAPQSTGSRGFGGLRLQVGARSTITVRLEDGDRVARPVLGGRDTESDTGSWTAEWQGGLRTATLFARYSRRDNVDRASLDASFRQHDASAQFFVNVSRGAQVFGLAMLTRTEIDSGGGNTYWQAGGGAQLQVPRRNLWLRTEATASGNVDLLSQNFVPRESISVGISGQLTRQTSIAFNVYADHAPALLSTGTPWTTRSTVRVTQSFSTGSARVPTALISTAAAARARGTGSVVGTVFADWNGNGLMDPDEGPLEGIPVQLASTSSVTTARDGQFVFLNAPAGLLRVGLDTSALPLDFDPPATAEHEVELARGDTRRVTFGLIPLGSLRGRIVRDVNRNGRADPDEELIDGAILVLDNGARSEQASKGRYRFDAVKSGAHVLKLLVESMPSGAVIAGAAEVPVEIARERLDVEVDFVVSVEKRPEVRKVFPPKIGAAVPSREAPTPAGSPGSEPRRPSTPSAAPAARAAVPSAARPADDGVRFAIQIAALRDAARASKMVQELTASGYAAYLVPPAETASDGLIRVRVGGYPTRAAALRALSTLEKRRGEKFWLVTER
jgi:cell division septation protein DedD